jgi:hypothetical protein
MLHLISLHARLQVTILFVLIALLLWGLVCVLRGGVSQGYTSALWVAVLLVVAQSLIGLALLFTTGQFLRMAMHLVYGGLTLAMLPGALLAARRRGGRREALIYTTVCMLTFVVTLRTYSTGGGG